MRVVENVGDVGVVVIGRNEGERLRLCLNSVKGIASKVYVDSGSTDGSCALARHFGFAVIDLDMSIPFTAARARNAGIQLLIERDPLLNFVQTVDGDCELQAGWITEARGALSRDARLAAVFGRRRERHPHRNSYHLACDEEWNVPEGYVRSCGGDVMLRVTAWQEVGGYNSELIAGEEPEMCLRMRQKGWRIFSNGVEMTLHDVAINRFSQWWKRSKRAGFAFAQLLHLHGEGADPSWRRLIHSAQFWTFAALVAALGLALAIGLGQNWSALLIVPTLAFLLQISRVALSKRRTLGLLGAVRWSFLIMLSKPAQLHGWCQYKLQRVVRRKHELIEYKN